MKYRRNEINTTSTNKNVTKTHEISNTFVMRPFFAYGQKSLFISGCVQGAII